MSEFSRFVGDWWLRFAPAGGAVLLVGWLMTAMSRQPVKRVRVGAWTLAISLGMIPLTLIPGWFALPWNARDASENRSVVANSTSGTSSSESESAHWESDGRGSASAEMDDEGLPNAMDEPSQSASVRASTTANSIGSESVKRAQTIGWVDAIPPIVLTGYAPAVLYFLSQLFFARLGLKRLWQSGRPAPIEVRRRFARMVRHFRHRPALRVSDRVAGPMCFGVFRPRVMLTARLAQESNPQTLRWMLAHELSHIERADPWVAGLLGFARAFYFFCPWFWWLSRSIRLNQEYLADAAASADRCDESSQPTTSIIDYADFLVRMARGRTTPIGATGVRGSSSDLFRRIAMLVKTPQKMETSCSPLWSLLAGGGLLTLGIALAGFYLPGNTITAAPDPEKKDAKKEELPKPKNTDDDEAVRKAIEALKKPPAPREKEKEEPQNPASVNPGFPLNPRGGDPFADMQRQQQEMMKRVMEMMQRQGGGQPGNIDDMNQMVEEMLKQMQGQNRGMFPAFPGFGGRVDAPARGGRLGIKIEKPSAVLVEQLDLPHDKGVVVNEVRPESNADKAGIKANDILMEIDGKAIPSELSEFVRMVSDIKPDASVDLTLLRKGRKETIKGLKLSEPVRQRQQLPLSPMLPRVPGRNEIPPAFPGLGGENTASSMSVSRTNDDFTVTFRENNLKGTITGTVVDGKAKVTDIDIDDNGTTIKGKSTEKLDPKYQKLVEKMTSGIR